MAKTAFSKKKWFDLVAPSVFNNKVYGTTVAADASSVKNRIVRLPLSQLTNSKDKYYMSVILKVDNVDGAQAKSSLQGLVSAKEYIGRIVRRGSDRIDVIEDVLTKDNKSIRVKLVGITLKNKETKALKDVRKGIKEILFEEAKKSSYDEFMNSIFQNKFQSRVMREVKKVYPLRAFEVRKVEVLN